jgi:hypothetical protein
LIALELTDGALGVGAEATVGLADVVTALTQHLLQPLDRLTSLAAPDVLTGLSGILHRWSRSVPTASHAA